MEGNWRENSIIISKKLKGIKKLEVQGRREGRTGRNLKLIGIKLESKELEESSRETRKYLEPNCKRLGEVEGRWD